MKHLIKKLLLVSVGLVFAFLLLEAALRIVGYSFPAFVRMDQARGWSLWPNQQGWTRNEGGKIYLKISSDGLRDVEHPVEKPAPTLRVAILGDSYSEAAQVQMDQSFWSVMGRQLDGCPVVNAKKVEVINFGVDGYGTDQELLTLREQVWSYAPDIIVLVFTPSNDVTDNSRILSVEKDKPFFVYQEGKLVMDASFRASFQYHARESWPMQLYYRAVNSLRVLQLVRQTKNLWRQRKLGEMVQGTTDSGGVKFGLADLSYRQPADPAWKDAWQVTEALLQELNNEVMARGSAFLVVTVTRAIQVNPDPELRRNYVKRLGVDNLFYPEQRIAALGKTTGFPVLTLAQPFVEHAERDHKFLHFGGGHWNIEGNHLAGEMIAHKICEIQGASDKAADASNRTRE